MDQGLQRLLERTIYNKRYDSLLNRIKHELGPLHADARATAAKNPKITIACSRFSDLVLRHAYWRSDRRHYR